jgi:hypothetical protein
MPLLALVLAFLVLAAPAQAQDPGDRLTVRIEGATQTLLVKEVVIGEQPVTLADATCGPASAAAALDQATGGRWDRRRAPQTILGETHDGSGGDRWAAWVSQGLSDDLCTQQVLAGDELLLLVDVAPGTFPLVLTEVPTHIRPGRPYRVRALEVRPVGGRPGSGELHPAVDALVNGVPTDEDGHVTIIASQRGALDLRAERGPTRSAYVRTCVTDSGDGFCGSATERYPSFDDEPGVDDAAGGGGAVRGRWTSVRDGQVFPKGGGPAFLRGIVTGAGAGVTHVRFRLTRNDRGRCFAHDPVRRRQRPLKRCTAKGGIWLELGRQARFEYAMPYTTPRGRWVLDVQVRDRAGRVSRLERGNTRVVFTVR